MKVIFNAQIVEATNSEVNQQGWLAGSGIFETIKTVDGLPWALSRHMRRAVNSAAAQGIKLPSEEKVREVLTDFLQIERHERGALRISFGESSWAASHLPYIEKTSWAKVTQYQHLEDSPRLAIKTYPYDHRLKILESVTSKGFDEALVINKLGKICEGAVSNLLIKIAGQWVTPPLTDGVLAGVMRALVIENCRVAVRSIESNEIKNIESAFLLGSLRIAQPISSIDDLELAPALEFKREIDDMALRSSVG